MRDVLVIGAGPAGCSAAVQAGRLGLDVLLMDKNGSAGGLTREARLIENYPGLSEPVPGREFSALLGRFLSRNGLDVHSDHAVSIDEADPFFNIRCAGGVLSSRSVIVATGTTPRAFDVSCSGVTVHRSIMDLLTEEPASAAVIGGGEAALDYALNLSDHGTAVHLLVRGGSLRAGGRLRENVISRGNIEIIYNCTLISASDNGGAVSLLIDHQGKPGIIETEAVLAAVGRIPSLPEMPVGIRHVRGETGTSVPGLFVTGDASLGSLGQISIASGQGVRAASLALDHINSLKEGS